MASFRVYFGTVASLGFVFHCGTRAFLTDRVLPKVQTLKVRFGRRWYLPFHYTRRGEKSTVNASQIHFSAFWIDRDLSPFSTVATEAAPNLLPPTVELIHFLLVLATRELIVTPY